MTVPTQERSRPTGQWSGNPGIVRDVTSVADPTVDEAAAVLAPALSQFAARMLQEMMAAALPYTWLRRAEALEAARPTLGDFHGQATTEALAARGERLTAQATACRRHAAFLLMYPDAVGELIAGDVAALMAEVV